MEAKNCKNCSKGFVIASEDFVFYEKMHVPTPDICPTCRSQERTAFRNESVLYKRKCDLSGKDIVSIYSSDKPYTVYDQHIWWGDEWDPASYGRDFDFSRPFFEQYQELLLAVPKLSIVNRQSTGSDYCNYSNSNKNCYLCFGGHENEESAYSWYNWKDRDSFDCLSVIESELAYESNFGNKLYRSAFLEYSFDCIECFFGYDLRNCKNCFLSTNLRNKEYYFLNEPLSKDDYELRVKEFKNGSYASQQKALALFSELKQKAIRNPLFQKNCSGCVGGDITYSKNISFGFDGEYSEDSKYLFPKFTNVYNSMDTNKMGYDRSDYAYMTIGCAGLNNCRFCDSCWNNHDLTYCTLSFSSSNLFGCVGLRHKKYHILNKEYSKEEYHALEAKIVEHMKKTGEWGKFFPSSLSPFAYNETTAQEYTPLSQAEAEKLGYRWREPEGRSYPLTLRAEEIPDNISAAEDSITEKIIECAHKGECRDQCVTAFRVTSMELVFYRTMNLPIPRLCYMCRHHRRLRDRNPLQLWHRACMCNQTTHTHSGKCENEFETSYAPERPETIYCEPCYQKEVN